jgi:queuine tRNA-ribosyltransferase
MTELQPNTAEFFEIKHKSSKSKARTGTLSLAHGKINTPVFMGIGTVGSVKGLTSHDLIRLNAEIILGNTYHLWLRPGIETIQKAGNLHKFINWQRPMLTDSGGFQAFSLSKIRKFSEEGVFFKSQVDGKQKFLSPEISMGIQTILGSDIALVLDECLPAEVTESIAKDAMDRTYRWAKRSKTEFIKLQQNGINYASINALEIAQKEYSIKKMQLQKDRFKSKLGKEKYELFETTNKFPESTQELDSQFQANDYPRYLFGIPQGAQFQKLRQESAKMTMELDFPGYSIGGVANGGEPEEIMYNQVLSQTEILEEHKPRHLLGVGTPKDIIEMVKRGIDMFDCVYPTRNARHGSIFVWTDYDKMEYEVLKIQSTRFITDFSVINSSSKLEELQTYSKAYLNHLFKTKELLAYRLATLNNLEFYYDLMIKLRQKIETGEI